MKTQSAAAAGTTAGNAYCSGMKKASAKYTCARKKKIHNCSECSDFPCDLLHPLAENAARVPHNQKVFNLCLIKKMGLEKWAKEKAASVHAAYFTKKWSD